MNTRIVQNVIDDELSKFKRVSLDLELFAARLKTRFLEAAYRESEKAPKMVDVPPVEETTAPDAPVAVVIRAKDVAEAAEEPAPKPKKAEPGKYPFTCVICGTPRSGRLSVQKVCSPKDSPKCKEAYILQKNTEFWAKRKAGKTEEKEEKPPAKKGWFAR